MDANAFLDWVEALPLSVAIAESGWLFPTIETVHVIAIALVVGSILMVDLRLVGIGWRDRPVSQLTRELLPWTWIAFTVAIGSGLLMWISSAVRYTHNLPFLIKLGLILLAGLNMACFHAITQRTQDKWDHRLPPPRAVKMAGGTSVALWGAVVVLGRWIGFV